MTPQPHPTHDLTVGVWCGRSLFLWCLGLPLVVLLAFVIPAWLVGRELVLPLDDVYIHFQYASQLARGRFYEYNPGLPPSSGATSLLYPYLLALGAWLRLDGLALGYWALTLAYLALVAACYALICLARTAGLTRPESAALATAFAITGPVGWHYASGMETGLLIAFMLWTLYGLVGRRFWLTVTAAALMAITRPEGAIMGVIAAGGLFLATFSQRRWRALWALLPVLSLGLQPLVNRLATGSATAAGSSAKSILSAVPPDRSAQLMQIANNFARIWWEFFTGFSPREGLYLPFGLLVLALVGGVVIGWRRRRGWPALVVLGWMLAGTAAVSTLDPAFWHFKRYQMPFMALLFPLAAWALVILPGRVRWAGLMLLLATAAASSTFYFIPSYRLNVSYLNAQQIPMARWLQANTPDDAVIAVHDVGLMRYLGQRTTVDMVGLTTPGAAASWRNGPGALAEFLTRYQPRPDYVAAYTDALGLSYLADTGLYGDLLVDFPVTPSDRYNVALAGAYQGVWQIDWSHARAPTRPVFDYYQNYVSGAQLVATVDVADLASEAAYRYTWSNRAARSGFPTEVYQLTYPDGTQLLDGGRLINGAESFTVPTVPDADMVIVTRLHPRYQGALLVYVDGEQVGSRTLPAIPGQWGEVATYIPQAMIETTATRIELIPNVPDGFYMPYYHTIYQGDFPTATPPGQALATYPGFAIHRATSTITETRLQLDLLWTHATITRHSDHRLFVHVYDDLDAPPIAQADRYPINGALPPGNWLPGELSDTIMVDLQNVPTGEYTVAIGLYHPLTGERLYPQTPGRVTVDGRLLLDVIEIE